MSRAFAPLVAVGVLLEVAAAFVVAATNVFVAAATGGRPRSPSGSSA